MANKKKVFYDIKQIRKTGYKWRKPILHLNEDFGDDLSDDSSIKVELLYPKGKEWFNHWVNAAYQIFIATWADEKDGVFIPVKTSFKEKYNTLVKAIKQNAGFVPLETLTIVTATSGLSRQTTHQWVRHRQMGFGQLSHRITDARKSITRMPIDLLEDKHDELCKEYFKTLTNIKKLYANMIDSGIPIEQARCILPIGSITYIVTTGRLRDWLDVLNARTGEAAQDEIQVVANKHIEAIKKELPQLYKLLRKSGKLK